MEINNTRNDWALEKLGDFASYGKGKKPKNQKSSRDSIFKHAYVDIEAFEKGIVKSYTDGEKCNFCSENDFLIVWDGSRSGLVGKGVNGALGSTLVKINFPRIENDFAYYFLKSKYQQINTRAKGTGTPHVDPGLLWNYVFPIAPLPEQRAIVAKIEQLFSKLDNGIANLKTAQDKLEIYRQAVLKKAFEGELTKTWREQQTDLPSADELLEQIKVERQRHYEQQLADWEKAVEAWEVGKKGKKPAKPRNFKQLEESEENLIFLSSNKLPSSWRWSYLGNVVKKVSDGPFGSNLKTADYVDSGIRVIRLENIKNLFFDDSKKSFITKEKYEVLKKHTVFPHDVIFSSFIAETTKVASVPKSIDLSINKADCFCIQCGYGANHKYLEYFLSTRSTYNQLVNLVHGATRPRVNTTQLKEVFMPLCSIGEQYQIVQEIESRLSVCDKLSDTSKEQLEKAEALRQSILKKAFEGRLLSDIEIEACKQEADWEPAEQLLVRIKAEKVKA